MTDSPAKNKPLSQQQGRNIESGSVTNLIAGGKNAKRETSTNADAQIKTLA